MVLPEIAVLNSAAQLGRAEISLLELLRRSKENFEWY
jgi:hypothetical protein